MAGRLPTHTSYSYLAHLMADRHHVLPLMGTWVGASWMRAAPWLPGWVGSMDTDSRGARAQAGFGTLLKSYRVAAGLSQEALAERARLSARAISAYECGLRQAPYRDTLRLLAQALGLSAEETATLEATVSRRRSPRAAGPPHTVATSTQETRRTNLPAPLTIFVGRQDEMAAVMRLLEQTRLLMLTGAGGCGKTKLAVHVAAAFEVGRGAYGSPRVHEELYKKKLDWRDWLATARVAHSAGLKSNATMLYGHIETLPERVEHLVRLRELQDETGGFLTFIPLAFDPQNTELSHVERTTGADDLKIARSQTQRRAEQVGAQLLEAQGIGIEALGGATDEMLDRHLTGSNAPVA